MYPQFNYISRLYVDYLSNKIICKNYSVSVSGFGFGFGVEA
jgi:hypothetical protein|tara:strand:- start:3 stop:125 length:123 start_codon:yes stop_codon:yes gene_type:complete